jgi:O-antigen/teichoic acid export membrane protein
MREGTAAAETRGYGRDAGLLTIALGTAGVVTYLYFALASHNLSKDEYGEIVVLWSAVYVTVATLFRPIEQLLARSLAELGEARTTAVIRGALVIQLVIAATAIAIALVPSGPIEDELLGGDGTLFAIFLGALVGFAASFFARGYLAGKRRFGVYASLLLVEGLARFGFALAVAVGIAEGRDAIAIGIAAGPLLSLLIVPFAFRTWRSGAATSRSPSDGAAADLGGAATAAEPEFTLSAGWGFASAVLLVMLSEQVILNAGPLLVRTSEGAAAAGFIFNVLLVARAPLVLFQAVAASLLPHLTRLRSRGDETGEEAFRLSVRATATAIAGFAAAVVLGVLAVGPEAMQIAFGEKFEYDRVGLVIVAAGMGFYLCAQTLSQAALAQGQVRRAAACWAASAAVFVGVNLIPAFDVFRRVEIAFTATAVVLCGLLYLLYRQPHPRREDMVEPGSAMELEAQLAAADEARAAPAEAIPGDRRPGATSRESSRSLRRPPPTGGLRRRCAAPPQNPLGLLAAFVERPGALVGTSASSVRRTGSRRRRVETRAAVPAPPCRRIPPGPAPPPP